MSHGGSAPGIGADVGDTYLTWACDLTADETAERTEILARLPDTVVDCHTHASPRSAFRGLTEWGWGQARSSFPVWEHSHHDAVVRLMYGDRPVRRLVMGQPFRGFDLRAVNDHLLATMRAGDGVILCGLPDDESYTVAELRRGQYRGLKMYPAYREPPSRRIEEFFPPWALAAAEQVGVPIVLHVPAPLADCVEDVVDIARRHPRLSVVLAHLGRHTAVDARVAAAFERVAECPLVVADTSMALSAGLHDLALATLGPDRVLHGSDEPFALLRYTGFDHPELGHRLMSPRRYHWIDPQLYGRYQHLAAHAALVHLQVMRALLDAVDDRHAGSQDVLRRVFRDNALRVFGLAE